MKTVWRVLKILYDQFFEKHCPSRAASLAYATLLSLVPLMMVGFYVLSWFPVFKGVGAAMQHFILSNFVADSASVVAKYLNDFLSHMVELSIVNIIFLGVVSVLMIYNMVTSFNEIWQVKMEMHFAVAFGVYLLVLLLTPLLFVVLLLLVSYFSSLPFLSNFSKQDFIRQPVLNLFSYLFEFFVFSFFNWILPSIRVRVRHALIAGLITAFLFELAKHGFVYYVQYIPTYRLLYGALSTIPFFLVWMYVSWLIILLGALICSLLSRGLPPVPAVE